MLLCMERRRNNQHTEKSILRQYRSALIWSSAWQRVWHNRKAGDSPRAGIIGYADVAAERYSSKNQRQPHWVNEPRRARCVSSRFLFGCQVDGWIDELRKKLTRPVSPRVARTERTRPCPTKPTQAICGGVWGEIKGCGNIPHCFHSLYSCSTFLNFSRIFFSFFSAPSSVIFSLPSPMITIISRIISTKWTLWRSWG